MRLIVEDIHTDGNLIVKLPGDDALIETADAWDWQEALDILIRDNSLVKTHPDLVILDRSLS